jgi:hypothetical protein
VQVVLLTVWSAVLASATATVLAIGHAGLSVPAGEAVVGAVAGGVIAFVSIRSSRMVAGRPTDIGGRLA